MSRENTISDDSRKILLYLHRKEAGFSELLKKLKISNHPLRRELRELCKEGYVERGILRESRRGAPIRPYVLTEKGQRYLTVEEEVRTLRERLFQEYLRGKITREQRHSMLQAEYKRLGVVPPTHSEMRERTLSEVAEIVEKLGPNMMMLIETYDDKNRDVCTSYPFPKDTYVLRKAGKGPLTVYLIEPTTDQLSEGFRKKVERHRAALLASR